MSIRTLPELQSAAAEGKVLVDFMASWCGPCKSMVPALDKIEAEGLVKVVKVDVDQAPELAQRFGVRSVPTLVLLKDGAPVAMQPGAKSEGELRRFVSA